METSFSSLNVNSIHVTSITEKDVLRALKRLKSTVTSGPDLIPAFPIRDCANVFSTSLLIRVTYGNPCYSIGSKANSIYFLNDSSVLVQYPLQFFCNHGNH
jgi:hypothetical protein